MEDNSINDEQFHSWLTKMMT